MITIAYPKGSNSPEFNPTFQKFQEICEIIVLKTVFGLSLISFRSLLLWGRFRNRKIKIFNILRIDLFLKKFGTMFLRFYQPKISGKIFFFFKSCQGHAVFFTNAKPLIWGSFFVPKINFILFFLSVIIYF